MSRAKAVLASVTMMTARANSARERVPLTMMTMMKRANDGEDDGEHDDDDDDC